ncbi:hypothetical protein DID88_004919 [Monilinia fructigena]|uniref:FAD dependent oxidoreductase domain-containing protein n=1 Tax=Monilinia fructigena TaxID=38457 RepID=A0A395ISI4_9HELO|nr:hypothetical protein DID88_004919 [Monilinia fructigena]
MHPLHGYRNIEALPENEVIDIVTMGAGYAGVATVYNLVKDGTPGICLSLSVMIIDARSLYSNANGRDGITEYLDMSSKDIILTSQRRYLSPDLYGHIPTYINRAGVQAGAEIAEFEIAPVQALKNPILREKRK